MLARVSEIETFRRWREDPDASHDDLVHRLTNFQPTEAMQAGTAFHKALELADLGDYNVFEQDGYTFFLPDCELELPMVRELRCYLRYGPLNVTGQVDALYGLRVVDHKTTANFSADGYLEGCQWRFYLDIFGRDIFRWNVFEITPDRKIPKTYYVEPPHILEQRRYPGMHADCEALALDFYEFAKMYLPERIKESN